MEKGFSGRQFSLGRAHTTTLAPGTGAEATGKQRETDCNMGQDGEEQDDVHAEPMPRRQHHLHIGTYRGQINRDICTKRRLCTRNRPDPIVGDIGSWPSALLVDEQIISNIECGRMAATEEDKRVTGVWVCGWLIGGDNRHLEAIGGANAPLMEIDCNIERVVTGKKKGIDRDKPVTIGR